MKIKHWLIPNKKNKFHPHILRPVGLLMVLAVLVVIPPAYNIVSAQKFQVLGYATNISVNGLNQASNQQRVNNGQISLNLNSRLNSAAAAKAKDMITDDYWSHIAPDGTTPWDFINNTGYEYTVAGENLAKGFYTSSDVVDAWMNSSEHRANILKSDYKDVGYAILDGTLQGYKTTLVVAMYGTEYTAPVAKSQPTTTTTSTPTTTTKTATTKPKATTKTTATKDTTIPKVTTATPEPTSNSSNLSDTGQVLGSFLSAPLQAYQSMNWGQKASILIVCTLILLFILKHTLIWRQQRRGARHIWLRSHPIGQASVLISVLVITLMSGVGVVL